MIKFISATVSKRYAYLLVVCALKRVESKVIILVREAAYASSQSI